MRTLAPTFLLGMLTALLLGASQPSADSRYEPVPLTPNPAAFAAVLESKTGRVCLLLAAPSGGETIQQAEERLAKEPAWKDRPAVDRLAAAVAYSELRRWDCAMHNDAAIATLKRAASGIR